MVNFGLPSFLNVFPSKCNSDIVLTIHDIICSLSHCNSNVEYIGHVFIFMAENCINKCTFSSTAPTFIYFLHYLNDLFRTLCTMVKLVALKHFVHYIIPCASFFVVAAEFFVCTFI